VGCTHSGDEAPLVKTIELDGMVDEEDIPVLDSWTERTAEDLWVLGDEVEQSLPVDLEFAPWHEEELIGEYGSHIDEYHG
jgi:hypothetical protein